ncbi:ComEC/Rec2 family competence protein [Corynebacterium lowii]|uniref:ComEC family competence protein n=1 Tax=Corynebacterium lowii TaxID=1544413 RepID=A0A0N8W0K1_9CORY|nr:ComEC/Rec2 family competence protein [Corynebacterium lowii]KQB86922.1 ComEC family competence protein [Corynebacterium lowii]MDP9851611.1 competence protein ComEC [Corynebacterium lowii]
MREARLVPAAALVWAVTLVMVLAGSAGPTTGPLLALGLVALCVLGAWAARSAGQAMVLAAVGIVAGILSHARWRDAQNPLPEQVSAQVAGEPRSISGDTWLLPVHVEGYPAQVPLFVESQEPLNLARGTPLSAHVQWEISERAGLGRWVGTVEDWQAGNPQGLHAWVAGVHQRFIEAVQAQVGEATQGLIPGMVLGNTTAQGDGERELYIATGLSHLSAVSGANVTIVATCAFLLCRLCGLGPRVQVGCAGFFVLAFFFLVGPEPSVLRATLTGLVGLLAVAHAATFPPLHGLSVAVIVLLLYDSSLATQWGFALSVAATAGIVLLYPLLYRTLAATRLPDVLVRALAVALAADLSTTPLVAAMSGRMSLVSVLANVLVAPAVAPITVIGLLAVVAVLLPGGGEVVALWVIEPCAWWIHRVAQWCASLPLATVEARPQWVLLSYAWVAYLFFLGYRRTTIVGLAVLALVAAWPERRAPPVELSELRVAVVDTEEEAMKVGPDAQAIVVRDGSGRPADYPSQTPAGVPVFFPHRDGPVTLHRDGTQHAADGRF